MDYIPSTRYPDYLMHHGTKGQKWGVRLYQNLDGSLTALGKARRGIAIGKSGKEAFDAKMKKAHEDEIENTRNKLAKMGTTSTDNPMSEESKEAIRKQALNSTDPRDIYAARNLLTTNEINERLTRIQTERRLAQEVADATPKKKTIMDRLDSIQKTASKVADYNNTLKKFGIDIPQVIKDSAADARGDKQLGTTAAYRRKLNTSHDVQFLANNINNMSDAQVKAAVARINERNKLKNLANPQANNNVTNNDVQAIRQALEDLRDALNVNP